MALLGQAHFTVGATGATIEIIRQIDPPANWFGVANAEGFLGSTATNPLVGQINAEGFAPNVIRAFDVAASFGSLNAEGFAPVVGDEFFATALLGEARLEGNQHSADWVVEGEVNASVLLGEINAQGFKPSASGALIVPSVGVVRVEGFAPTVIPGRVIYPQTGEFQTYFAGTTHAIEKIRIIDGPDFGTIRVVGKPPVAQVYREGGIWFASQGAAEANAEGFAPGVTYERTVTSRDFLDPENVESFPYTMGIEGFAPGVSRPNVEAFTPLVGVVNAEGISATITTGRWTPVGSGSQIWSNTSASSGTWTPVDEESTTWTPVDEAV